MRPRVLSRGIRAERRIFGMARLLRGGTVEGKAYQRGGSCGRFVTWTVPVKVETAPPSPRVTSTR